MTTHTDHSDHLEDAEQTLNIPSDTTARYRMCRDLVSKLFFTRAALAVSAFLNLIFIWAYKL